MTTRIGEHRSKAQWIGGVVLAAALCWVLVWSVHPSRAPEPAPAAPKASAQEAPPSARRAASAAAASTRAPAEDPAPIIDEIEVEKPEVCAGEENLITVRSHTTNGTDEYLHSVIGTRTGSRVPLRVWPEMDGSYEMPTISVFGRNNVVTRIEVPRYKVNACKPERIVVITHRLLPSTPGEFELTAQIVGVGLKDKPDATPFKPASYAWVFDDGGSGKTKAPFVTHSYERRPQTALVSEFLIRVEVQSEAGEKLTGRALLQIPNTMFQDLAERGIVTIAATPTPRFPRQDGDGVVRQTFRLWHHGDAPVRIDTVTAVRHYAGASSASPLEKASLSLVEIPPGQGVDVDVSLDTVREPDVFTITYILDGETAEGHAARGTFSLMKPPPAPTKESSTPVTEPVLLAKIKRARELLAQEFVTDEDIWRLEREGKMADLDGSPPPAPAP
ncbi:hypothetical protein [Sorangium atrum]|uniref:PKD domain-containing protein n=1 Tax=Sorangium atrum TaxID=2995308 RepID=A0ABT5C762_9BACT|nr:hypothetical protein [Sorangium aterium]MDC0682264.1 hypothetical protein [Sorangium aterium]